jgi:parallel beta-helix repeat protein
MRAKLTRPGSIAVTALLGTLAAVGVGFAAVAMAAALMATGAQATQVEHVVLSGGQALASNVSCGDTINADTTLHSDLVNCPNNGIVIGADDIALDLNGHKVTGDGAPFDPCPEGEFCDVGLLNDGHDGVTVKQGRVRQFAEGVFVAGARHNRVLGISSSKNAFFGFVFAKSARSLIRDSSGNRNLAPEGDGMGLFGSHDLRVVHNSFRHNALGIHVDDSPDNLIRHNRIVRNSDFGILMVADRNRVRRNRCVRNGACINVELGNRNVIARNHVHGGAAGISVEDGRGNRIARNVVVHTHKISIYLGLNSPPIGGSHNVVSRNRVRRSGGDGFVVREKDHHSRLRRNIATGSGDDGFDVESRTTKLSRNRAAHNGDLGIEAVRGVIDGGGNIARHNGDPRQCTHIVCN